MRLANGEGRTAKGGSSPLLSPFAFRLSPDSRPGHAAQQILDLLVRPADARAHEEGVGAPAAIEEIVPTPRHVDGGRKVVAGGNLAVCRKVRTREVEELARESQTVPHQPVVDRRASARLDDAGPPRQVPVVVAEEGRDGELVLELLGGGRRDLPMAVGER